MVPTAPTTGYQLKWYYGTLRLYLSLSKVKIVPLGLNSRRAFDILLSYHLGSAAFPRDRNDRVTIERSLPQDFRGLKKNSSIQTT